MGEAFGESCREPIRELYERRVENALAQALAYGGRKVGVKTLLEVAGQSLRPTEKYDEAGFAELLGIARAANLAPEQIGALNGLTDLRDVLAWWGDIDTFGGCTSFVAQQDLTRDGRVICGQTWDLASDNMPYVVCVTRYPENAPPTWCLTTVGCLSLIGMNADGIAMGTTNIRTTDAKPGVCYLSIIHKALSSRSFNDAVDCVTSAQRAGGHFYYIADKHRRAAALECSATKLRKWDVSRGYFVHTNHCLDEEIKALEGDTPAASSCARQSRLEEIFGATKAGDFDLDLAKRGLSDRENAENAICRYDFNGISTNGAVVMSPELPGIWACHGQPDKGTWVDLLSQP